MTFLCRSFFRILISRMAVIGDPYFSLSMRTFFKATMSFVSLQRAMYTYMIRIYEYIVSTRPSVRTTVAFRRRSDCIYANLSVADACKIHHFRRRRVAACRILPVHTCPHRLARAFHSTSRCARPSFRSGEAANHHLSVRARRAPSSSSRLRAPSTSARRRLVRARLTRSLARYRSSSSTVGGETSSSVRGVVWRCEARGLRM